MRMPLKLISIILLGIILSINTTAVPANTPDGWNSKVDPQILRAIENGETTEIIVYLNEQADLRGVEHLATKREKGAYVFQELTRTARRAQQPVIAVLEALGVEYRQYWIANMIWVRGDTKAIEIMAKHADVDHLYANPKVRLEEPDILEEQLAPAAPSGIEWNLSLVNADDVWAAGYTGQGAVVGGQDTGYDWDHPALINQYRGWDGVTADHNYNWHDAIHQNDENTADGNPCGFDSPVPCDDGWHGTHTMGTIVGDDGGDNQVGMAPGARWIGCRNMEQGWGTPITYAECYQWFVAPTDLNGENPRPDLAPDVINNSWGCPTREGCNDPQVLLSVVENVRTAGIVTVHSAGNSGSNCTTVNEPAAIYDASFTIGATDTNDNIANFSSRGPVTVDGSGRLKPDVAAPGVNIRSSVPSIGYSTSQGTSNAAPHVAGLVALLISAEPALAGQVDILEQIITQSAVPRTTDQTCGGVPGTQVPNNTFGWGRIDALTALQKISPIGIHKSASTNTIAAGQSITYTLEITSLFETETVHNVVISDVIPAQTEFITATLPHTLSQNSVSWTFPSLDPGESQSVTLVVGVHPTAGGNISNAYYGITSDETSTILGIPVTTEIRYKLGFPLVSRGK